MAKVTGPLLSMDASGKIADAIVFTRWRGVKVVRQYVIPANPNTAAQQTQRGYLSNAIHHWVSDTEPAIQQGWRNYQAGQPISGVNEFTSRVIGALQDSLVYVKPSAIVITPGNTQVTITWTTAASVKGNVDYGTKHRVYSANKKETQDLTSHSLVITGLTNKVLYYFFVGWADTASKWSQLGEYSATPTD